MELSYSLHLGNDKNKTKKARQTAKKTLSKTTSSSNNAIQNFQQLSKVNHHNLRQYDNNQEKIEIIKGSNNIVEDVKQLYLDLFEEARIEYNEKQNRNDRKIDNYFRHISDDDKHDLACEIIIELGDMFFWEDKELDYWKKMSNVFKNQISDLEELLPNFKIANATIHYDEHSPHLHIVGVAFKDGNKNGMKKQVGKSDVFNKTSLINIQDVMRNKCIKEFNYNYNLNATLRSKELGRNLDYSTDQMDYYKDRKELEVMSHNELVELNLLQQKHISSLINKWKKFYSLLKQLINHGLKEKINLIFEFIGDLYHHNLLNKDEVNDLISDINVTQKNNRDR